MSALEIVLSITVVIIVYMLVRIHIIMLATVDLVILERVNRLLEDITKLDDDTRKVLLRIKEACKRRGSQND